MRCSWLQPPSLGHNQSSSRPRTQPPQQCVQQRWQQLRTVKLQVEGWGDPFLRQSSMNDGCQRQDSQSRTGGCGRLG